MRLHGLEPGALVRLVPRGLAIVFRDCGEWTAVRTSDRSVELRAAGLPTEIAGHPRWIESVGAAALAMFALCGVTGSARLSEHRAPKRAAPWSRRAGASARADLRRLAW